MMGCSGLIICLMVARKENKMGAFLDGLKQPSAWRGLVMLLAAVGINLAPETGMAIVSTGMAVSGLIGTFVKD